MIMLPSAHEESLCRATDKRAGLRLTAVQIRDISPEVLAAESG